MPSKRKKIKSDEERIDPEEVFKDKLVEMNKEQDSYQKLKKEQLDCFNSSKKGKSDPEELENGPVMDELLDLSDLEPKTKEAMNNAKWGPDDTPPKGGTDAALARLIEEANKVNLDKLGLLACDMNPFLIHPLLRDYIYRLMKFAVAQAKTSPSIYATTEGALVVRDISPYEDLLDGALNNHDPYDKQRRIPHNQWFQPTNIRSNLFANYDDEHKVINVYHTGKACKNDLKVYIIYGLEFLNGFKNRCVERVDFWRGNVKLITYIDIDKRAPNIFSMNTDVPVLPDSAFDEKMKISYITGIPNSMYHNDMIIMNTAVLYRANNIMQIKFHLGNHMPSDFDEIKIRGFVVEPLGLNVMG